MIAKFRPGRWTVTAGVALVSLGLLSFNASATFTGTQAPQTSVTAGDMTLALANPGSGDYVTVAATEIAPGDDIERVLNLTSGGSVDGQSMQLTVTEALDVSDSILFTGESDDTTAMTLLITRCSVAWDTSGHPYTCGGVEEDVWPADGNPDPINDASAVTLSNVDVDGTTNRLRILMELPSAADDSFQNEEALMEFAFSMTQRAGTWK